MFLIFKSKTEFLIIANWEFCRGCLLHKFTSHRMIDKSKQWLSCMSVESAPCQPEVFTTTLWQTVGDSFYLWTWTSFSHFLHCHLWNDPGHDRLDWPQPAPTVLLVCQSPHSGCHVRVITNLQIYHLCLVVLYLREPFPTLPRMQMASGFLWRTKGLSLYYRMSH